jgi:UDP-N-acetyl-2-amino-2-deoxyglucuronate dehydrogenase
MNVGIIGTGAIANLHARVYRRIGFTIVACTDVVPDAARRFAAEHGCEVVASYEDVCRHPIIDYVDVCTLPNFRLEAVEASAASGKHVQVQKPMATNLDTARHMIAIAARAGILLGVVSQHRFDESSRFLKAAMTGGRLGVPLQFDAYVKWYRSAEYYSRPVKGSWNAEGGGALINQAIHQVDLLRWLGGAVQEVFGMWQLGAAHRIESEDVLTSILRFESGATGTIQASTAFWPGYPERIEIHGTKGTAVVTGDRLTTWDVQDDAGEDAPVARDVASGASDPMAISLDPFERQFLDFAEAIKTGRPPLVSGEDGYQTLQLVDAIYRSCRIGARVGVR